MERKGKLIVFEGIDGCGKGTQIQLTSNWLTAMGVNNFVTKSPGGSRLGMEIRKIMFESVGTSNIHKDALDLLFMANHVHNLFTEIIPRLVSGVHVIADRHWPSAMAYMADRGSSEVLRKTYDAVKGMDPDLMILMHGDPAVFVDRANKRTVETHQKAKTWNNVERLTVVQNAFISQFEPTPWTRLVRSSDGSELDVFDRVRTAIVESKIFEDREGQQ